MLDIFFIIYKYFINFDNLSINKLTKGSINETYKLNKYKMSFLSFIVRSSFVRYIYYLLNKKI